MENKKILITGATDGIGRQTALELAQMGYPLVIHGRKQDKVNQTSEYLGDQTGNKEISSVTADFASLGQVDEMGRHLKEKHPDISVIINNAGVFQKKKAFTEEGYEKTFAINHLAVFKLTLMLIDTLRQNTPARIVTVASMAHQWGTIDFDNLNAEKGYDAHEAYSMAKLCNILFTYKLAEKLEGTGITTNCLHPGVIGTKLLHEGWGGGLPVEEGSQTPVYLATSQEVENISGKYFANKEETQSNQVSYDKSVQQRLWDISLQMTGMDDPFA